MTRHRSETALAWLTLVSAVVHFSLETYYHVMWGQPLQALLVDYICNALMLLGGWRSLAVRPASAAGLLAAAWAFALGFGWRSVFGRLELQATGAGGAALVARTRVDAVAGTSDMTTKIGQGGSTAHPPPLAGEGDRVSGGGGRTAQESSAKKVPIRPSEERSRILARRLRRSMTHAEVLLWQQLRHDAVDGLRFRRQHPIGPYVADFVCAPIELVVEIDGATHSSDAQVAHDRRRSAYMARQGWKEIRFSNFDVYDDLPGVMEAIWRTVRRVKRAPSTTATRRSPSPASGGGCVRGDREGSR